ncbi:hypothetical protein IWW50_000283 [Coemansia erecta]|nr:hypothetical protein IWW50_000283 [Coemansia erecta]
MHFHTLTAATQLLLLLFCTVARADKGSLTIGYYSTWTQKATEAVGFSKYTHVIIAFAEPHPDGTFAVADFDVPDAVSKINKDGAHALVSIGGWSYSGNFSTIMATSDLRTAFAKNIVDYVELNKLAGIDIDWEFPGSNAGDEENTVDEANDTINYLTFLQELRKLLDSKFPNNRKLIMMAVGAQPFCVNGAPMTDLSEFAHVVDYANLMLYDFYGSFSETSGPNAPLSGTGNSVKSVIKTWTDAKWPAAQLIAGFAFYGHSFLLSSHPADISTNQIQPKSSTIPQGGKSDTESPHSGVWQYNNLRTDILSSATTANAPWVRYWDNTSMTPYLYNKETCVLISYDDPESIQAKVQYAMEAGIPGGMVWTIDMDCHHELLDVVSAWQSTNGKQRIRNNATLRQYRD